MRDNRSAPNSSGYGGARGISVGPVLFFEADHPGMNTPIWLVPSLNPSHTPMQALGPVMREGQQ